MTFSKPEDHQPGTVEFSAPLETSVPLEAPRPVHIPAATHIPASTTPSAPPKPDRVQSDREQFQRANTPVPPAVSPIASTSVVSEETIRLLEERLVVNRIRRKVGEVIVRKEIETRMIEVPIRREKLIVEQVSPSHQQLAVIDLGQSQETEFDPALGWAQTAGSPASPSTIEGKFTSVHAAMKFLDAIAHHSSPGLQSIQVSIVLEDAHSQPEYQRWLENNDRASQ
ncbi:MAG: DUF2382 domain-containing protein [Oscillatoriophycideae cyanobacterium NC_groundwater_1537_Pr4_S-0.65um_50_18]|nr:DUF2382 domain-containing protein [Oscillatoriophycideae cyanobacterium NC_groundwater_1537_Pr4_S-0.65um_50_18]